MNSKMIQGKLYKSLETDTYFNTFNISETKSKQSKEVDIINISKHRKVWKTVLMVLYANKKIMNEKIAIFEYRNCCLCFTEF